MSRFLTLLSLILICQLAHTQSTYIKHLKGNQQILIYSRMTDDNSIYLAGTLFLNNDSTLMYGAKLDAAGDMVWGRVVHTHKLDFWYSADVIPGQGLVLAGIRSFWAEGINKIFLLRLDADGDTLWTKVFDGYPFSGPKVRCCSDGGFIVGGESSYYGLKDFYLLKLDQDGNNVWANDFYAEGSEGLNDIIETSDGNFLMVGSADGFGSESGAMYVMKVSAEGNLQWSKIYDESHGNIAIKVLELPADNFLILGETSTSGTNKAILLKINGEGDTVWTKSYSGMSAQSMTRTLDGNYLIAGYNNNDFGDYVYQIIKIDSAGNILWNKGYYHPNQNMMAPYGINCQQLPDNTIILGGWVYEINTGDYFNVLIRLDANGDISCDEITYVSDVASFPVNAISVSPVQQSFDLTVSAAPCELKNAGFIQDYCLATSTSNTMQNEDAFSIFPNPSSDIIKITTSLAQVQQILIRNLVGEIVISKAFSREGMTDLSALPSGVYFVELKDDSGALVGMQKIMVE